jgi:hypothetical protein
MHQHKVSSVDFGNMEDMYHTKFEEKIIRHD